MTAAYYITDWSVRYEVNDKGRAWKMDGGVELRKASLLYIRRQVYGRRMSAGFEAVITAAGSRAYEVLGFFDLFLGFAAVGPPDKRGVLRNHRDELATVADLARMCRATVDQVEYALSILCDNTVGWIRNGDPPGKSGAVRECPGESGPDRAPLLSQIQIQVTSDQNKSNPSHPAGVDDNGDNQLVDGGFDLVFTQGNDLDLDLKKAATKFIMDLDNIYPSAQWTTSENTTFRNLIDHIKNSGDADNFVRAIGLAVAAKTANAKKPKAKFIAYCKDKLGFIKTVEWESTTAKRKAQEATA